MGLAIAQNKQVSGTVIDENGEPVVGASVIAKGAATVGTATDGSGKYAFSVPESVNRLIVRYIGYNSVEVEASLNVQAILTSNAKLLDEVVVTALGIQRPERSLGNTKTIVNPEDAVLKAEPDLFRSLNGKIPGVNIGASSATAGSATKVTIRGNSSFYGNNDPLYVVDGVPYSNPEIVTGASDGAINNRLTAGGAYSTGLSTLDPNDIESMNVLKGAAAAALYGSRAANGVILITTKSGSKKSFPSQKKTEVTLTASYAVENIASLPEYQNMYGQGSNFMYSNANGSWGPAFGGALDSVPTWSNYLAAYPDMPKKQAYKAYPNNVKDLFQTGNITDLSANIMRYTDGGNFSTTVSRLAQDGYIPESKFERTSFSVGGNQKLENGLTIGGTMSYARSEQDGPFFGAGNYGGSVSSFARTLLMPRNIDAAGLPYETPDQATLFPFSASSVDNPLWSWKYNKINSVMDRTITSINAAYDFTSYLSAYYSFGWNQYELDRKQVINIGSTGPGDFAGAGQIVNDNYTTQELESNFNLTYKQKFNDFDLRAVLGHNVNQYTVAQSTTTGNKMIFKGIYNVDNTQEQIGRESHSLRRLWALYADVLLGYKNYAFLNFTLRNDHSSTLPVKNNSYFYPALSGSFIFSDALEINPKILNYGKIRLGWGKVGKDAGPYYVNGYYNQDIPFAGRPLMYVPTTSFDPELKPEFTTEFETGTELQFFNSRIGIDFTWYNRISSNQIAPVSLPASTGSSSYYTNFGELKNSGIELGLTLVPVSLKNSFKWSINAIYSKNVSEVLSLIDGVEKLVFSTGSTSEPQPTLKVGYPYGFLFGSGIARDTDGTPLVNPSTGAYLEATELIELGNPYPDFQTAITNTFSFKGVYLSVMFDAKIGGVLVSGPASDMMGRGVTKDTEDRLGTRILPGVYANPNTHEPLLDANGNRIPNTIQLSENDLWFASASTAPTFAMNSVDEFATFDATVFRLSELTLGYDLPKQWLAKTFLGGVNLSVIARNLWHYAPGFPKYSNYDPGSNAFGSGNVQGIDRESAPSTRRIAFNVKVTF
jgi:TonB-linked SusC/RagA family outer membrane protein